MAAIPQSKPRHVDFYPDEYIAGVSGQLPAVDQGVYWMVCSLVYSRGGPIDNDHAWLSRMFADTHWRTIRASLDRLITSGKIQLIDGAERPQITVRRCARELERAVRRSAQAGQAGRMGGRPPNDNNGITKADGSAPENQDGNPTNQLPTTNQEEDAADAAISPSDDFEKLLFDQGKAILGKNAGGMIAKLLKTKKGDALLALHAVLMAAKKQNPREYVGRIIKGQAPEKPTMKYSI